MFLCFLLQLPQSNNLWLLKCKCPAQGAASNESECPPQTVPSHWPLHPPHVPTLYTRPSFTSEHLWKSHGIPVAFLLRLRVSSTPANGVFLSFSTPYISTILFSPPQVTLHPSHTLPQSGSNFPILCPILTGLARDNPNLTASWH